MNAGSWVARRRSISEEASAARHASGPRFERFAAAMQAAPPSEAQVLPETAEQTPPAPAAAAAAEPAAAPKPAHLRPAEPIQVGPQPVAFAQASVEAVADAPPPPPPPDVHAAGATVIPRRPVIEDAGRPRADVPWLGIGSWLLLCAALFASLVGWPGQIVLDRVTSIWSDVIPSEMLARTPGQGEPPAQGAPVPADKRGLSAMTPSPGHEQEALPPTELAPPIRSEATGDAADGPPLPRFKPSLDQVATKFSNAFLEFGDRLQQQGDFDAALHMRRQGTNLDPSKAPRASNL